MLLYNYTNFVEKMIVILQDWSLTASHITESETIMGGSEFGGISADSEERKAVLHAQFNELRMELQRQLRSGAVKTRHGEARVPGKKRVVFRGFTLRRIRRHILARGMWTSFGVHDDTVTDPDEYDIFFVSSEGEVGRFVLYLEGGFLVDVIEVPDDLVFLEYWISGMQTLLGLEPNLAVPGIRFSVNPA